MMGLISKYFLPNPLFITYILCMLVSCKGKQQTANNDTQANLIYSDSAWFSIDSLPEKVKPNFKILSSLDSAIISLDTVILFPERAKQLTVLNMEGYKFKYIGNHALSNDPADHNRGEFINGIISFDGHETSLTKCIILHKQGEEKISMHGFNFIYNENPRVKKYRLIRLNNIFYYIFIVGSADCGTCSNEYTIIIEKNKNRVKYYILEDGGGGDVVSFENWFWGDMNGDGHLDVYLLYLFGDSQRDDKYGYLPFSIEEDTLILLQGYPKYHLDFKMQKVMQY